MRKVSRAVWAFVADTLILDLVPRNNFVFLDVSAKKILNYSFFISFCQGFEKYAKRFKVSERDNKLMSYDPNLIWKLNTNITILRF